MGPQVLRSLPFTCRMLQSAAAADVVESKEPGGIFNVMLPVAVPDEGTFDWLDDWLEARRGATGNDIFAEEM